MTAPEDAQIDVLIPAYNAASTIAEAVGSIQAQTLRDIRIVVVDDGSTDATGEILADLARQDSRIEVISTPNGGIVDALNIGLAACRAPYVARHDADDIAFPERLEKQLTYLRRHPGCIAVGTNAWHIDATGRRTGRRTHFDEGPVAPDPYWVPSREPYLMHPFLLVRRQALLDVGGYRHVFHSEDTDLYWRLMAHGELRNMAEILGEYRVHAQSVSSASIVNGRTAAVNAQLAALSERRRRDGRPDLVFPKALLRRYSEARTLEGIIDIAAEQLTPDEVDYLRLASAAKLISLFKIRPYRLERSDCLFVKAALRNAKLPPGNAEDVRRLRISTNIGLLKQRQYGDLLHFLEPRDVAGIAPRAIRYGVRKATGRPTGAARMMATGGR